MAKAKADTDLCKGCRLCVWGGMPGKSNRAFNRSKQKGL